MAMVGVDGSNVLAYYFPKSLFKDLQSIDTKGLFSVAYQNLTWRGC